MLAGYAGYLFGSGSRAGLRPYLDRWVQWDAVHYRAVAEGGYVDPRGETPLPAFFPGLPLLLRGLHLLGFSYPVAGLVVSFLAGGVAVVALVRLAELDGPRGVGERAVLLLLLAPTAVFLAAGYTEALFLAFAVPAWLAARRGRWWLAGALAAGASAVRISGLFLAAALIVEFLVSRRHRRAREAFALALPLAPPVLFAAYLERLTGDWLAYVHAQEQGWYRDLTDPVQALRTTWEAAFGTSQPLGFAWMFRAELVAVLVAVLLTAWLLWRQRWGEATYIGLQLAAFATSTWYFSVPRASLLWWPLWIGLARWSLRRPAVLTAYLAVAPPLMVVFTCLYVTGHWAG